MKKIFITLGMVVALIIMLIFGGAEVLIDIQWFHSMGYLETYLSRPINIIKFTLFFSIIIFGVLFIYWRVLSKAFGYKNSTFKINKEIVRFEKKLIVVAGLIISIGVSVVFCIKNYEALFDFVYGVPFYVKDPIFNMDLGFYIFKLPLLKDLISLTFTMLVIFLVITILVYFVYGERELSIQDRISLLGRRDKFRYFLKYQISIFTSILFLVFSLSYIIRIFNLVYSKRGKVIGPNYVDIKISIKFFIVIAIVSFVISVISYLAIRKGNFKRVAYSVLILFGLISSNIIVSNFMDKIFYNHYGVDIESPYIEKNIISTREAFDIDKIENKDITYKYIDLYRLQDSDTLSFKYNSSILKEINDKYRLKPYYKFFSLDLISDVNKNTKYMSPREIYENFGENVESNWTYKHFVYTHGYGAILREKSLENDSTVFHEVSKDVLKNPEIYFGENTKTYAIVNTNFSGDNSIDKNLLSTDYKGKGINMSFINRILFSISKKYFRFLSCKDINRDSKILINRDIYRRVKKITPFIDYDEDAYALISDGRIKWVIDGYSVTDKYPLSHSYDGVNYIRNSVKAVIDSYDGSVEFYVYDKDDPFIKTYENTYPDLFKSCDDMPEDIKNNLKYPKYMFELQTKVLGKYNINNVYEFLEEK